MGAWGKAATARIPLCIWAKVIIRGGGVIIPGGLLLMIVAEMEFRRIIGWTKRAYYGESAVENDDFAVSLSGGIGAEFSSF